MPISPVERTVTVHVPCSGHVSGWETAFLGVARACAETVVSTPDVLCCGQAGDRGFLHPELPAASLEGLAERLPDECATGYSCSRTCEIALERHAGRPYVSLAHLVLEATLAAAPPRRTGDVAADASRRMFL